MIDNARFRQIAEQHRLGLFKRTPTLPTAEERAREDAARAAETRRAEFERLTTAQPDPPAISPVAARIVHLYNVRIGAVIDDVPRNAQGEPLTGLALEIVNAARKARL